MTDSPKIRVLIADDSAVVRRLLTTVISEDPGLEVAGTAANGRIALEQVDRLKPDVLILDVEMPEMGGLEVLVKLRRQYPRLPVIIFSTLTQRGAEVTIDALTLGANDYVTKPSVTGGPSAAADAIRAELLPKIKVLSPHWMPKAGAAAPAPAPAAPVALARPPLPGARRPVDVVAIGVSTGGPPALATFFEALPADFPVPVVLVQHMPPLFTKLLAERLSVKSKVPVAEAAGGEFLRPGLAWIAPGNFHMTVVRDGAQGKLVLNQDAQVNFCRPSVDVLFGSLADAYGPGVLAVVMTGMGVDGLRGATRIRDAGGCVLAQDQETSVVWGMPRAVAEARLAEKVLPISELGPEVVRRVAEGRAGIGGTARHG